MKTKQISLVSLLIMGFSAMAHGTSATIFIHGTLFTFISYYYHGVSAPQGITLASEQPLSNTLGRLGRVLAKAAPAEFPLDSLYLLGWPGRLNADARKKAAEDLLAWIKKNNITSLTLIGHSHGGTIALLLAQLLEQEKDLTISVDRLILIACPVQKVTSSLVTSPILKKYITFIPIRISRRFVMYSTIIFVYPFCQNEFLHLRPILCKQKF